MFRFYRFIRRNTRPVPENIAEKWSRRLNFMYIFFAWNAFGVGLYYLLKSDRKDRQLSASAESWAAYLDLPKTKIIRVKGLSEVEISHYDPSQKHEDVSDDLSLKE